MGNSASNKNKNNLIIMKKQRKYDIENSIVKISINNENIATGFLIKIYKLYYLIISNFIKSVNNINQYKEIDITYEKNNESFKLNINQRFIKIITEPINITIIEIFENDINLESIKGKRIILSPDFNYKNKYEFYKDKEVCSIGYNKNNIKCISKGKVKEINKNKFKYLSDSSFFSVGSPIYLLNIDLVIGISVKNENGINYGIFIGELIDELNKNVKENEKDKLEENVIEGNEENQKEIERKKQEKKSKEINIREIENEDRKEKSYKKEIKEEEENKKIINEEEKKEEDYTFGIYYLDKIIKKNKKNDEYDYFFYFLENNQKTEFFVNVSIFDKKEYDDLRLEFLNKEEKNNLSLLEKACIGSILGMAIGDAIGARVEFKPLNYDYKEIKDMGIFPEGRFKLKPGQWTDDTSMGLCIADSLIENKGKFIPKDIMMRFILWWKYGYNNGFRFDDKRNNKHSVGLGGNIKGSLLEYINNKGKYDYTNYGDKNTSGNGSIMRNAAIPICYFREEKVLEYAKNQSLITHQGDEAAGCCQLLTYIIIEILKLKVKNDNESKTENSMNKSNIIIKNKNLKDILDNLKDFNCEYKSVNYLAHSLPEGNNENRNWNWKDKNFKYSKERSKKQPSYIGSYCMDCLSMALHVLYTTNTFKDAILKAVNLCGDADSLGSVVGQIAGAYYGLDSIPKDWINKINEWDQKEIALRGYILLHLKEKKYNNYIIKK